MAEPGELGVKPPGVSVLESAISSIDPSGLRYRGIAIEELTVGISYEDIAWLVIVGEPPTLAERAQFAADIAAGSAIPAVVAETLARLPAAALPAAAIQAALPLLALSAPALAEDSPLPGPRRAGYLLGAFATLVGAVGRRFLAASQTSAAPLTSTESSPSAHAATSASDGGVAARLLRGLRGGAGVEDVRALELVLILYADHELNASTFAARVAASTRADLVSCVLAGLCALRGPLHGGVDRHVSAMLAAAEYEGPEAVVERYIRAGEYLPGFGHAVYRGMDPRAVIMRDLARRLAPAAGQERLLATTEAIEAIAEWRRLPAANVDLYAVVVYRALGIPVPLSTLIFASGRLAGWCAHILEQRERNRLIRPRAAYIGPVARHWPAGVD